MQLRKHIESLMASRTRHSLENVRARQCGCVLLHILTIILLAGCQSSQDLGDQFAGKNRVPGPYGLTIVYGRVVRVQRHDTINPDKKKISAAVKIEHVFCGRVLAGEEFTDFSTDGTYGDLHGYMALTPLKARQRGIWVLRLQGGSFYPIQFSIAGLRKRARQGVKGEEYDGMVEACCLIQEVASLSPSQQARILENHVGSSSPVVAAFSTDVLNDLEGGKIVFKAADEKPMGDSTH